MTLDLEVGDQSRAAGGSIAEFEGLADDAPVMMWVTDPGGRCLYLNRRWYEFTGQTREEAEDFGWLDATHPDDRAEAHWVFLEANARCEAFRMEYRLRRADGIYRWAIDAASPRFAPDGVFLGYVGSVIDIQERREAEARLAISEERLRLATEAAGIGHWDVDVLQAQLYWPASVKQMFGISPERPITMDDFFQGLHPDDRERTMEAFRAACDPDRRALYDVEYRTVGKEDGLVRWVAAKGRAVFDATGRCERVTGVAIDLTATRLTEDALRQSEERYRTLFEAIDAGFCVTEVKLGADRVDYRVVEANPAFYAHTGFPKAILGRWLRDAAPTLEEHWFETYGRVAATGVPERLEQGSEMLARWFDVYAFRVGPPSGARVAILFNDISARRNAETQLRLLNEQLEIKVAERTAERDELWRNSGDLMLVAGFDGRIIATNPAWEVVLGWTERELAGRSFLDFVHPDDLAASQSESSRLSATGEDTLHFHNRYRRKAGDWIWLSWAVSSKAGRFYAVARDITAERAQAQALAVAQEALRHSQKMEAMGSLTGGVAHDFNNLLTPIIGSLDILQRRGLGGEREHRQINYALQSAERARILVQRLLAFARRQPLQPAPVDLETLVQGMIQLIGSTLGPQIRVTVEVAPELPNALADPNQLEMALLNLAVNARDAMPEGGALTITAAEASPPASTALPAGRYVCLAVTDTGAGMEPGIVARAIEPFFSTKGVGRGTGLGLSMVHGLASQLGGALGIQSRPGQGTTIEVWLPATQRTVSPRPPASLSRLDRERRGAVL
ncbi:MAG: PAS domain S-box protein [Phenylobacterium sp.]|nr:PAS domain S-box protein [Phenylobacterium sp.]